MNISANDYKNFSTIEIEINQGPYILNNFFIHPNAIEKEERKYYHIYFDNNKEEINGINFKFKENTKKIKIIIDKEIISLENLFLN